MHEILRNFWASVDTPRDWLALVTMLTHAAIAVIASGLLYMLCRKVLSPLIHKLVVKTKADWDRILFNPSLLRAISLVVFAISLHVLLPDAFAKAYTWVQALVEKLCEIFLVWAWVILINRFLEAGFGLLQENERTRMQPLKGLMQMLKLICIIVGIIISISVIINKNPSIVLTSLGASAAVLMLVFKDTILGVVAGVQLSANDMLRKGDWIVVPGTPVNGTVTDVSLTTVKVQNFDNTTLTVPPYNLVSGTFQNWRGMTDSGGRRIMRSVIIDYRSVRFLTADEIAAFQKEDWFKNVTDGIDATPVNLTAFRYYMEDFIRRYSNTKTEYTFMVRQLEPTNSGVPIQVYCFTDKTDWVTYEHIQADIFDHIYAVITSRFGLSIYQAPSSDDIRSIGKTGQAATSAS